MSSLSQSIQKTISYAGYFNFPVSSDDIYLWLISSKKISKSLVKAQQLKNLTSKETSYREKLNKIAKSKVIEAKKISSILKIIPSISMIAVTGSVAISNPKINDDIDLMIVTKNHTLWLTRTIVTLIIYLTGRKRPPKASKGEAKNTFCLNLWLEEGTLSIPKSKRNLYTAHEVLQVMPIFDRSNIYQRFLFTNKWVNRFLANAFNVKANFREVVGDINSHQNGLIRLLLAPMNYLCYLGQLLYMKPKITTETISLHYAYFHKIDFSFKINKYLETV